MSYNEYRVDNFEEYYGKQENVSEFVTSVLKRAREDYDGTLTERQYKALQKDMKYNETSKMIMNILLQYPKVRATDPFLQSIFEWYQTRRFLTPKQQYRAIKSSAMEHFQSFFE
jgi:hypothetical protein